MFVIIAALFNARNSSSQIINGVVPGIKRRFAFSGFPFVTRSETSGSPDEVVVLENGPTGTPCHDDRRAQIVRVQRRVVREVVVLFPGEVIRLVEIDAVHVDVDGVSGESGRSRPVVEVERKLRNSVVFPEQPTHFSVFVAVVLFVLVKDPQPGDLARSGLGLEAQGPEIRRVIDQVQVLTRVITAVPTFQILKGETRRRGNEIGGGDPKG